MKSEDGMKTYFYILSIIAFALFSGTCFGQSGETFGNAVRFDRTTHDFGTIKLGSGPVECVFTFENISGGPMAVYNVVTSCGCTTTEWTKEPIMPGGKGNITIEYTNDEGPYPFDKTITVYMSNYTRPILLRVRGVCIDKEKKLDEIYTESYGALGLRSNEFSVGNIDQGKSKGDEIYVANTSASPARISFTEITPGLEIEVSPNPIPAGTTAKLSYTVTTGQGEWGKTVYEATPVVNGKAQTGKGPLKIRCFIKEDFSGWSEEEIRNAALPMFNASSYTFNPVAKGTEVKGSFSLKNHGKSPLVIHKIEADSDDISFSPVNEIGAGKSGNIDFVFDTSDRAPGEEVLIIATLTTNAPKRPMINIFIQGFIK